LNIYGGRCGIYLQNCSSCNIVNNSIYYKVKGIHILSGNKNVISYNIINRTPFPSKTSVCTGISLEDTPNNIIKCNRIENLDRLDIMFYFRNSSADVKIIIPANHGILSNMIQIGYQKNQME